MAQDEHKIVMPESEYDFRLQVLQALARLETNMKDLLGDGQFGIGTTSPQATLDTAGQDRRKPVTFSSLTACGSTIEGETAAVYDSTTNTWGATITGSGTNHVLAYCDGTNWTVAAK